MASVFQYHENLYILEDPVAYRRKVVRYLKLLETTYTGLTLLKFIYRNGQQMLIMPYSPSKDKQGAINAYAQPGTGSWADYQKATTRNFPVMQGVAIPNYGTVMLPTAFIGNGMGTTVTVKYHPAIFRQLMANSGGYVAAGMGPGEVLFHEMLHGFRMMSGKMIRTTVPEHIHMDDFEEFCAIAAANIYRSERGFKQLRLNHHGSIVMQGEGNDPAYYATHFKDEFKKWFDSQKDFCLALAASDAKFNPMMYAAAEQGLTIPTPMTLK